MLVLPLIDRTFSGGAHLPVTPVAEHVPCRMRAHALLIADRQYASVLDSSQPDSRVVTGCTR